ncbi:MAG TPA: SpoIIE family protein phosphatase [Thermoanaerobaculia bacterium]|nr:SpoIIE family protein phosphatase [Thermoanaerobaculia bacterium]
MKIRTSLVLACFLLSVVPLGVIVVYSYFSSRHALQRAYHAEAVRMTAQLDRRLSTIRDELQQRLAEVSALPDPSEGNVLMTMGDAASLVNSIEINPVVRDVAPKPPTPGTPAAAPEHRMVIRIPRIRVPRFTMSQGQRQNLQSISQLAGKLRAPGLTDEQRQELQQQIGAVQAEFNKSMQESQKEFAKSIAESVKQRQEQRAEVIQQQREAAREAADNQRDQAMEEADRRREKAQDEADARADASSNASADAQSSSSDESGQEVNVGNLQAHVSTKRVVHRILSSPEDATERDEIPFAIDRDGNVYTRNDSDLQTLQRVGIPQRVTKGQRLNDVPNWVVVAQQEPESGLQVGVARPVGEDLEELRNTSAKNFGYGVALIFVALIGIVPVANHITGDIALVTRGAERIAHGDLTTRLPVRSNNEVGQLATAFNRMAEDLSLQQQTIVEQERAAIEYERKSVELEEARRFQLSMLPKEVPQLDAYDIAVFTHTAAEVGGDYYDFHVEDGGMALTIGDATGHGARAGTMVAVIKALFAGYSDDATPSQFLRDAGEKIRRMDLGRMAMALSLARFHGRSVTLASAGMPPVYVHRHDRDAVEEIAIGATPLGTIGDGYRDTRIDLASGDTMLFLSDGFPELMNAAGQQLGYPAAMEAFAAAAKASDANAVIASLQNVARNWHGEQPPNDDVTFVVVRARESARSFSA